MDTMEVNGELVIGYRKKYLLSEYQVINAPISSVQRLCRYLAIDPQGDAETLLERLQEAGMAKYAGGGWNW